MKKLLVLLVALTGLAVASSGVGQAGPTVQAAPAKADAAQLRCGKTRNIGFLGPFTGPAASLGAQQRNWLRYFVIRYNATHSKTKIRVIEGDTKLGGPVSEAVRAAQFLAGKSNILGVVGPSGSQEVEATTAILRRAGLAFISPSATRTTLTDGTRAGYFFRVVPPDAIQSTNAVNYITQVLKLKRVYIIDDQSSYSQGLADEVQAKLRAAGATVERDSVSQQQSDFSSLIAKISRNTQVVYLPWQLPPRGQAFGRQMQQAGRGNITLMGADGLYDDAFASVGRHVYTTNFPVRRTHPVVARYLRSHGQRGEYFGTPSYVAAQAMVAAVDRACKNGSATRAEVRRQVARTVMTGTVLGLTVKFNAKGDIRGARFGVYRSNGTVFQPVS